MLVIPANAGMTKRIRVAARESCYHSFTPFRKGAGRGIDPRARRRHIMTGAQKSGKMLFAQRPISNFKRIGTDLLSSCKDFGGLPFALPRLIHRLRTIGIGDAVGGERRADTPWPKPAPLHRPALHPRIGAIIDIAEAGEIGGQIVKRRRAIPLPPPLPQLARKIADQLFPAGRKAANISEREIAQAPVIEG